jgi:1,4-alpha-glucan branching enzyme
MARTATTTTRAPRGTKIVADAFFAACNEIPEPQRADVTKAALTMIRDRLKDTREKAKLAHKQKAAGKKAAAPTPAPKAPATTAKKTPGKAATPKKAARKVTEDAPTPEAPAMTPAAKQSSETEEMPVSGVSTPSLSSRGASRRK